MEDIYNERYALNGTMWFVIPLNGKTLYRHLLQSRHPTNETSSYATGCVEIQHAGAEETLGVRRILGALYILRVHRILGGRILGAG